MKLSIVIPVYNEEENLSDLYNKIKQALDKNYKDYEIIFVDDGSKDGSFGILEKLQKNDPKIVALKFRKNFGQTAAISAGFEYATGDVIITMDADLQNDPQDIPKLLQEMQEKDLDIVNGWRAPRKDPFLTRRLPSYFANMLISSVTGVKLHDYGCTLKAFRKDVVKELYLHGEMHRFIPAIASKYGAKIGEVKVSHHPRTRGKSKYGISRTFKVVLDLIAVKFFLAFSANPIRFFGSWGLGSSLAGTIILLHLAYLKLVLHHSIWGRPLLLFGILLVLVGTQFIAIGLLGEMLARIYHEAHEKPLYIVKKVLGKTG